MRCTGTYSEKTTGKICIIKARQRERGKERQRGRKGERQRGRKGGEEGEGERQRDRETEREKEKENPVSHQVMCIWK